MYVGLSVYECVCAMCYLISSLSALSSLYPIWLNGVSCTSKNTNITQCGYTKPIGYGQYCTHTYDVVVDCQSTAGVFLFH